MPINRDYHPSRTGADGKTLAPLQAPESRDDVIRANDGGYVGLAFHY